MEPSFEAIAAADLHDEVEALEERIEELAETARGCRKLILLSKFAVAGGLLLLAAALLGYGSAVPMTVFGVAALVGGIVLGGSNVGTLRRANEAIAEAERLRARLTDEAGLTATRVAEAERDR